MNGSLAIKISFVTLLLFCLSQQVSAETTISYRGISSGKAWIYINNRLTKLSIGQKSEEGVKLLTANKNSITLLFEGKKYQYNKNSEKAILLENEVELLLNPINQSFYGEGAINGQYSIFIVDTGASFVVLNKIHAKKLNIPLGKKRIKVSTASKDEVAHLVTLDTVRVGNIELKDVPALVTNNDANPDTPLLGMSFLKNVKISQDEKTMTLSY